MIEITVMNSNTYKASTRIFYDCYKAERYLRILKRKEIYTLLSLICENPEDSAYLYSRGVCDL